MTAPLARVLAALQEKDLRPRPSGSGYEARCPAHEDHKASLGVAEKDGKAVLLCRAGCETSDVLAALGLTMRDLFPEEPKAPAKKGRGEVVARYPYRDEAGALLFEVVRMKPKDFRQRRPDPAKAGAFLWNLDGVRRVLFRLPEVLSAAKDGARVYVVEGEKDAESLARLGLCGTCNPGGAGKWLPGHSEALRGAHVVILPDADEPGRKHGEAVAVALHGVAASVRVARVPRGKDVSDWIEAGGTREAIEALGDAAPAWAPVAVPKGGDLLADVVRFIRRFVILTEDQAVTCALWVLHAHAIEAADVTPYLCITSPERRCGKSRLMEVLQRLAPRPWYTVRPSEAILFRKLTTGATLFLDEYDTIFSAAAKDSTEGIRATLNAGFSRGIVVSRCAEHGKELLDFEVFGPKVLAGIADPPATVKDRSFVVTLRRARRDEARERFRSRKATPEAEALARQAEAFFAVPGRIEALRKADPALPDALNDRAQDAAEPLLAIADLVGGEWPARAREALVALAADAAEDEAEDSVGVGLLRDLVTVFQRLGSPAGATTDTLVRELHATEGTPWKRWNHGDGLDAAGLAALLRAFRISPQKKRWSHGAEPRGGYRRDPILDAAARYVPAVVREEGADRSDPVPGSVPGGSERLDPHGSSLRSAVPTVPAPRGKTDDSAEVPARIRLVVGSDDDAPAGPPPPSVEVAERRRVAL